MPSRKQQVLRSLRCNLFVDYLEEIEEEETRRRSHIPKIGEEDAMTSSQFAQTFDPSQEEQEDCGENYVAGVDGDFNTRLRWWIDASPGTTTYHIQLCCVFEAGACINTNSLEKEPQKRKEMAIKYSEVCKSIAKDGIILPSEIAQLKTLKHATKKVKKSGCD